MSNVAEIHPQPEAPDDDEERIGLASDLRLLRGLRRNFIRMSICFSLNHACVTSALALSTANLGPVLGNASNAVLYIFYTCTALVYAGPHVRWRGSKAALVDSSFAFCAYVGSFYVAEVWAQAAWVAALTGAAIGGVAAGILFTAQGVYFTLTARAYVQLSRSETGSSAHSADSSGSGDDCVDDIAKRRRLATPDHAMEDATAFFGSAFAFIYLLCEITFKLVAWILPKYWPAGWAVVTLTYLATAVAAAAVMVTIWHLDEESGEVSNSAFTLDMSSDGSSPDSPAEDSSMSRIARHHSSASVVGSDDGSGAAHSPVVVVEAEASTAVQQRYSSSSLISIESDADTAPGSGVGHFRELLLLLCERQMLLAMGLNLACGFSFLCTPRSF